MLGALFFLAWLQAATPQSADEQFIHAARAASASFQDRNTAIRAGYRKLGPEIPEMGEHWINPIMIVESRYDVQRPAMLTYATINGRPVLTGVAYALAMRGNETPPATGVSGKWHDHTTTVSAELTSGAHGAAADGSRVVVMHAWVWVSNPDGAFADENWSLPYLRAGLKSPARIDRHHARALALLPDGGVTFYANVLRSLTDADFTPQLHHAARRVATESPETFGVIWRETVEQITNAVSDANVRQRVQRALGVNLHSH
jgi:hypothetical protein